MNLRLTRVTSPGDLETERLVLEAIGPVDIGDFAVFAAKTIENGDVTNETIAAFWFPDVRIERSDRVILYSKRGVSKVKKADEDSPKVYFFYMDRESTIWHDQSVCPVLVRIREWDSIPNPATSLSSKVAR